MPNLVLRAPRAAPSPLDAESAQRQEVRQARSHRATPAPVPFTLESRAHRLAPHDPLTVLIRIVLAELVDQLVRDQTTARGERTESANRPEFLHLRWLRCCDQRASASSEIICPTDLLSCRARSLTAWSTPSAIPNMVRMLQMPAQHASNAIWRVANASFTLTLGRAPRATAWELPSAHRAPGR